MALKVLSWNFVAGKKLPDPVLGDDRDLFPQEIVRAVLSQLQAGAQVEEKKRPANIQITLGPNPSIMYKDTPTTKPVVGLGSYQFQTGQFEIWFRDKKKVALARYVYFGALHPTGKVIIGPCIKEEQVARIQ